MWQVPGPALYDAPSSIHVDPEHVAQERLLDGVRQRRVGENLQQLLHTEYRLADRLNEPVLALLHRSGK